MNFDPDRYKKEASNFNGNIDKVNSSLESAITSLNMVDEVLGFDAEGKNDILTYNVIASNEEIKSEIKDIKDNIRMNGSTIDVIAKKLDEEEKRQYELEQERLERIKRAKEREKNEIEEQ